MGFSFRAAALSLVFISFAFAEPPAAPTPILQTLDDNRLLDELADRGMGTLIDHYFATHSVSDQLKEEINILLAVRNLNSPAFAQKSEADRRLQISAILIRIDRTLPQTQDPERLERYADSLLLNACKQPQDLLELWGENPRTQAQLNPVAEAVDRVLARADALAKSKADALASQIKSPDDPKVAEWNKAAEFEGRIRWTRANAAYGLALSYDRASPQRAKVAADAIEQLKQFDEQGNTVQLDAELSMGKLSMAEATAEGFKGAREYFAKVIKAAQGAADKKQHALQDYQARYFSLVTDLLDKKPEEARKGLSDLKAWEDANLPNDPGIHAGLESARSTLEYRIDLALAAVAPDAAAKARFDAMATDVLTDLLAKRPDLRAIIGEQTLARLPDNPDFKQLNPLMLDALLARGVEIVRHTGSMESGDSRYVQMAADAAREIVRRKGQPGISNSQVDNAAYSVGVFEDRIGSDKASDLSPAERLVNEEDAVEAYLNYVEHFGNDHVRTDAALDRAIFLAEDLHRGNSADARGTGLYDRMLDLGFHKLGRSELASANATRQREKGDFAAAASAYAAVKSDNPAEIAKARYWQMYCDQQLLRNSPPAQAKAVSSEIEKIADDLTQLVTEAMQQATDAKSKAILQLLEARSKLIAAEVARSRKNSTLVLKRLDHFESNVSQLSPAEANELLGRAMFLRVNALIALNRGEEAIQAVRDLIAHDPTRAPSTISQVLKDLNENYTLERGKEHPDLLALNVLAGQRAQLSALLLEQVQKDPSLSPKTRQDYLTFNAHSQVEAAKLETDPTKRQRYLTEALNTYEQLLKGLNESDPDYANLRRLIALAEFEIGDEANLQKAHDILADLFESQKFGTPLTRVGDETRSNDLFWEGLLRLLQCKSRLATAKNEPALREEAVHILKNYIIQFGDQTGGEMYAKDYRSLRKELLGHWKPE